VKLFTLLLAIVIILDVIILATPFILLLQGGAAPPPSLYNEFYSSLTLSLYTSLTSSLLAVSLSIPIGYYVSRRVSKKNLLLSIIMAPSALSPAAIGLLLLLFFAKTPVGQAMNSVFKVVNNPNGIIVAQFFLGIPIGVSYFTALFSTIPRRYEEVSLTMGFGHLEYLLKIAVPMVSSQVASGFILVFTRVLGDFGASYILGGGIRGRTVTLPIFLFIVNQVGEVGILVIVLAAYVASMLALVILAYQLESVGRRL